MKQTMTGNIILNDDEIIIGHPCIGVTISSTPCSSYVSNGDFCYAHRNQAIDKETQEIKTAFDKVVSGPIPLNKVPYSMQQTILWLIALNSNSPMRSWDDALSMYEKIINYF